MKNTEISSQSPVKAQGGMFAGKKYHFVGAGGIGMSGLAKVLLRHGAAVSGSDMEDSFVVQRLRKMGADIRVGHNAQNLADAGDVDAVVVSAAIKISNPEYQLATEKNFPIFKYAQMLGKLMDSFRGIAIAGTHGKSTTSGWLSYAMSRAGCDPNYIVGADVPQLEGSSGVGHNGYFIAESCEYDRSFLNIRPEIAVILNVEQDHLDYYRDEDDIVDAFAEFACGIRPGGTLIVNAMDKNTDLLLEKVRARMAADYPGKEIAIKTFGMTGDCDYYAENAVVEDGTYSFDLCRKSPVTDRRGDQPGRRQTDTQTAEHGDSRHILGRLDLAIPGVHNVGNALAVAAAADCAGADIQAVADHISSFTGVDRRLMVKAEMAGVKIMDDYAHHPTEIRASLKAIRERYSPERIICIFQPHQYSRTRFLLDDFAESFKLADITIVPEIYFVRDTAESKKTVNAQVLVDRINSSGSTARFIGTFDEICDYLKETVDSGDVVVTMGAGDIWKVADEYIFWLRRNS